MCARFDNVSTREVYRNAFDATRASDWNYPPRYNIAPTDTIPIIRFDPRDGAREMVLARWGFMPFWMKEKPKIPHINARAETVDTQPMFREAFQRRRALIPATGFFEWQARADGKQPWRFVRKDRKPFAFAGLWEFNKRLDEDNPRRRSSSASPTRSSSASMTACR